MWPRVVDIIYGGGGGGQLTRIVATIYNGHWIQRSIPAKSATKLECQARIAIKGGCAVTVARSTGSSASSPNKTGNDVWRGVRGRRMKSTRLDIREACSAWTGWVTANQIWSRGRCIDNWILVIGRNSEPPPPSVSGCVLRLSLRVVDTVASSVLDYNDCYIGGPRCLKHAQWEVARFERYTEKW